MKITKGDLAEVKTRSGYAYIQYVARHPDYGDMILVFPALYQQRPPLTDVIIHNYCYLTFYPLQAAVKRGLIEIIGREQAADYPLENLVMRRSGAIDNQGKVLTWVIEEGGREVVKQELSEEERKIPIASIWNHEALLYYIEQQWRPEKDF